MNKPSGPRKTANLSESIHHHLNNYALAAGAAGVSVLALAQPTEAKIVYTPANVTIGRRGVHSYHLDLNHDGITDLTIQWFGKNLMCRGGGGYSQKIDESPALRNLVEGKPPAALSSGAPIGSSDRFYRGQGLMVQLRQYSRCGSSVVGNWWAARNRYLGVEFKIHRKTRFGWARISVSVGPCGLCARLTGYAYESIPGKSIVAGKTHGPSDDPTNDPDSANPDEPGSGASVVSPIIDTPQPASLGILALGAQGVPLWRRKESALEGDLKGALL
jgi:hypothetical protein